MNLYTAFPAADVADAIVDAAIAAALVVMTCGDPGGGAKQMMPEPLLLLTSLPLPLLLLPQLLSITSIERDVGDGVEDVDSTAASTYRCRYATRQGDLIR